jgi:hypothetical protein
MTRLRDLELRFDVLTSPPERREARLIVDALFVYFVLCPKQTQRRHGHPLVLRL